MAERAIKEVKRHVRVLINDVTEDKLDYTLYIPLIMRIMNTTTSEYTKVRPCELLYCTGVDPDRGIIIPLDERKESRTTDEYMQKMADVEETLFKLARDRLHRHDATHLQAANNRPPPTSYAEGLYVILEPADTNQDSNGRTSSGNKVPRKLPLLA